jgi:hypothetical protein
MDGHTTTMLYGASLDGPQYYTHNPTLRLFSRTSLHTTCDDNQTRPQHTPQTQNKHQHHGAGAANPSSGMDLLNTRC